MLETQGYKLVQIATLKAGDVINFGHDDTVREIRASQEYPGRCTVVTEGAKFAASLSSFIFLRHA